MVINLGIHHLRAIAAIDEEKSFTAAAASLGLAQSSLSRSIQEAERRLKTPLFHRSTRKLEVTADGTAVAQLAREIVRQFDSGMQHIEGYLQGIRGNITIATLPSLAATFLPPVIRQYQTLYPDVQVQVSDSLSEQVLERLQAGVADLAVTVDTPRRDGFTIEPIAEDSYFLAVHPQHRFADCDSVDWASLEGEPLVEFTNTSSVQQGVALALREYGVTPATTMRAQNVAAVAGLVAAELGVAPVPGFVRPLMGFAGLRFVPLLPEQSRRIAMIRQTIRPLTPAVRAWIEVLRNHLTTSQDELPGVHWLGSHQINSAV